jgi:hypothetical protein
MSECKYPMPELGKDAATYNLQAIFLWCCEMRVAGCENFCIELESLAAAVRPLSHLTSGASCAALKLAQEGASKTVRV